MEKPVIRVENVSKVYDMGKVQVKALDGVSLAVYKGQFISIMGQAVQEKPPSWTCLALF